MYLLQYIEKKVYLSRIYLLAYIETIFKINKLSINADCPTDCNIP